MKKLVQLLVVFALLGSAGGFFALLVLTKPEAASNPAEEREWVVDTISIKRTNLQPNLKLFGRIISSRDADLRPLVEGRIVETGSNFYAGGRVRKGELLVAVDTFKYETEIVDAEAAVLEANAALEEAKSDLAANQELVVFDKEQETLRKIDLDRKKSLLGNGVVSGKSFDDARFAYLSSRQNRVVRFETIARLKAQVSRLTASVTRAEVRLKRAKRDLEETRLHAPFDGILVDVSAAIGKRVSSSDKIARLIDLERLEARFHMSDAQFGRLAVNGGFQGRPAEIIWRAGETLIKLNATLSRVQGEFDATSGGVWLYAPISGGQNIYDLRPGAFVEARTPDISYENVFRVPESAVYDSERVYFVKNGRLVEESISVLTLDGFDALISGDIAEDSRLVVTRIPEIAPGLKVQIRE
ncbi:MAG: efflux RND transporter periplasmic adaptor subunit [Alphaproteobacteria bacterium]